MQKSKRLIRNTILALNGIVVLYVGINRLYAIGNPIPSVQRTSAAELAMLRDFSAIEVNGDFGVDLVQEADYSVYFTTPDTSQGNLVATVRGNTLVLSGFHNATTNRVRVALPVLTQLKASSVATLSVSGFDGESMSLRFDGTPQVILRNNGIRQWHIVVSDVGELKVDRASISSGQFDLAGQITLRVID